MNDQLGRLVLYIFTKKNSKIQQRQPHRAEEMKNPEETIEESGLFACLCENIVFTSDHISTIFPLWGDFIKNLQHVTGLRKCHLLLALVSLFL